MFMFMPLWSVTPNSKGEADGSSSGDNGAGDASGDGGGSGIALAATPMSSLTALAQ
jgi:hypothetical protein